MRLIIPAQLPEDLQPLADALGATCELLPWDAGQPLPNHDDALLVDARAPFAQKLAELVGEDDHQPIVFVVDGEIEPALLEGIADNPWMALPMAWPPAKAAAVIVSKLASWHRRTNAEVARTETARKELNALQNEAEDDSIELMVKNTELSRLRAFRDGVLSRLGDPERGYIADIGRQVNEFDKHEDLPGALKNIQVNLHHTALSIQHIFRSFDYWQKAERALDGRTILVCCSARKTRKLIVRGFSETKSTILWATEGKDALDILRENAVDVLFLDWENVAILEEAQSIRPDLKTVMLTSELLFEGVGNRMLELPLQNVLITSDVGLAEGDDEPMLLRELSVTAGKLLGDNIFGLEKYLSWGAKIHEILITSSDQRFEILDKIGEFAPQAGLRKSMCQNLETLTDELVMNAIWDAPVDETGHHKYASLSRRKSIQLLPHECPVLRYGADSRMVGISVTDPFGGLERDHAYRYIVKCFAKASDQIDKKKGGAGLGLYTAFLSVSTFIINVAPGFRTEVIGLLDNTLSRRKLSGRSRSYHFFLSQGPPQAFRRG